MLYWSTALFGAVDCHIQLKKRERSRTVMTTQRYGEDLEETVIDLDRETGLVAAVGDLQTFNLKKTKLAIMNAFAPNEALDESEIKNRVEGCSRGAISKALRSLVEEESLDRGGEGVRGKPFIYSRPTECSN
jgi:hypothetical protein